MTIERLTCRWAGFQGAPGYSVFYARPGGGVRDRIATFMDGFKNALPSGVTITIPTEGDVVNEVNGQITGTWTNGTPKTVLGTNSANYSAVSGVAINWQTADVVNGRRVRGRTFMVPLSQAAYGPDGQVLSTYRTEVQNLADLLISSSTGFFGIWHRPVNGAGGSFHDITAARVKTGPAVLRSRRD